ncbi:MAG: hypothetical protein AMXMBFR34_48170 [Myxococcaceae bacterium]
MSRNKQTGVDVLPNDHVEVLKRITLALGYLGLSTHLKDAPSSSCLGSRRSTSPAPSSTSSRRTLAEGTRRGGVVAGGQAYGVSLRASRTPAARRACKSTTAGGSSTSSTSSGGAVGQQAAWAARRPLGQPRLCG